MSHIKKFSYPDTSGRWLILAVLFIIFFNTAVILSDAMLSFKGFFPYFPMSRNILLIVIASLFAGNLIGRLIYSYINKFRFINICISLLFAASVIFYSAKEFLPSGSLSGIDLYILSPYHALLLIAVPSLLCGILNSYCLKICCGDFIDEKNMLAPCVFMLIVSIAAGMGYAYFADKSALNRSLLTAASSVPASALPILFFFIRIPFRPEPLYAQHLVDEDTSSAESTDERDDLFFTYINFSYILVYIFLGYLVITKFYGSFYNNPILYFIISLICISAGIITARISKNLFWHIYSEMLYPICFLFCLFALYRYSENLSFIQGIALSGIPSFIFGFSLRQTVRNIALKYDHEKRFNIVGFSLFIMPVPIIILLTYISFTNTAFFLLLYSMAAMNILIPGIFMFNINVKPVKKILYFMFSLIFIPAVIFMHLYFKIPLTGQSFHNKVSNYSILRNTNYNIPYITGKGTVKLSGVPVFHLSDSTIRNMKRAASATVLFNSEKSDTLIIDGNQKFFRNPSFAFYENLRVIDAVPDNITGNNRLPFSGRQLYASENLPVYEFLSRNRKIFDSVVDSPNIMDQLCYGSRFSKRYYSLIKKNMKHSGVYSLIINLQFNSRFLSQATLNLKNTFSHHRVFLFSNIALITASDDAQKLIIRDDSLSKIKKIIDNPKIYGILFYSPIHPLNNILFSSIDNFIPFLKNTSSISSDRNRDYKIKNIPEPLAEYYLSYEPEWFSDLLDYEKKSNKFSRSLKSDIIKNSRALKLLKMTEYSESVNNYENETDFLFSFRKLRSYHSSLKEYIQIILAYKEKYYYDEAVRLEKEKKWDQAATLYRAILNINKNNFDANYRFGLLYITVQDLDNAFKYLNAALKLNREHPNALYQMGVLMFSSGKTAEAIGFLEKAREQNEKHASLYMYLGLAYDKIGKPEKARDYLEKAIIEDPNDKKIKSLLEETLEKIKSSNEKWKQQEERTNMIDDEKDEDIILPVNKKALRARLMDEEKE